MRAIKGNGFPGVCDNLCNNDADCDCIRNCYGYSNGLGAQHCGKFFCGSDNSVQKRCTC
jgi:hypothetical protein